MGRRMRRGGLAVAVVAAVAGLGAPGTAAAADSDSCAMKLERGYVGNVYSTLAYDTSVPDQTRVCFRVDDGAGRTVGGVYTITSPKATVGIPRADASYEACSTTAGNTAPGPHPAIAGTIGGQPVHADTYVGGGEAWVCVRVGDRMLRVVVPSQGVQLPVLGFEADTGPRPAPEYFAEHPSAACGVDGREYVNMRVAGLDNPIGGFRVVLGTRQPSPSIVEVCFRVAKKPLPPPHNESIGGRLTIDTGRADLRPTVTVAEDTTGCTSALVDLTAPARVFAGTSATGTFPYSVCVQVGSLVRRVTVGTTGGVVLPTVTFSADD